MNRATQRQFLAFSLFVMVIAFAFDTPQTILEGLKKIILTSDVLTTDYFAVGGVGAAIFNSGLITFVATMIIIVSKAPFTGNVIASVLLMTSFGLFGKNILNIIPILLGTFLYSKLTKEPYRDTVHMSLLATCFSPIVSELMFNVPLSPLLRYTLSISVGMSVGLFVVPVARSLFQVHKGYTLANIGFSIGILSTLYVSVMKSYGYVPVTRQIVSSGNNTEFSILLSIGFITLFILGIALDHLALQKFKQLCTHTGLGDNDFFIKYGMGTVLVNMAVNGFIALIFLRIVIRGDLTGPSIGGILTIVGFSGLGKHWRNITPIFLGVYLGGITKGWSITNPSAILGALFSTSLAPISGTYGWFWGALAGFFNSSVLLNSSAMHAGMNLYNTGFSTGIVAAVFVPVLETFKIRKRHSGNCVCSSCHPIADKL